MTTATASPKRPRETFDPPAPPRRRHRCKRHRGVTLVTHPRGWQARWAHPDLTGKKTKLLASLGLTREEACCRGAVEKRAELLKQRRDVAVYGVARDDSSIRDAVAGFVETKKAENLRPRSVATVRDRLRPFVD